MKIINTTMVAVVLSTIVIVLFASVLVASTEEMCRFEIINNSESDVGVVCILDEHDKCVYSNVVLETGQSKIFFLLPGDYVLYLLMVNSNNNPIKFNINVSIARHDKLVLEGVS